VTGRLEHLGEPGDLRDWVRVANTVLDRINGGQYEDRLPARDVVADELGVKVSAVQRAYRELAGRDVIYRAPGRGYSVREAGDPRAWVRVMDDLLGRIARGELKPYDRVPARDALCGEHGCSLEPVMKALAALERRGAIRRMPGNAYAVMPEGTPSPEAAEARERLLEALRWAWDGTYRIGSSPGGKLEAWRMDGSGTLHADTPEELRDLIRGDYGLRPVAAL
jgi:DNA-binding GntR family transcriptional regulator